MNKRREWIELGKMYEAMSNVGQRVTIFNRGDKFVAAINHGHTESFEDGCCDVTIQVGTVDDEWFDTPYEALKFQYFTWFLEQQTEVVPLDLPVEMIAELFEQADREGITIDELVTEILTEALAPPVQEASSCCGSCSCPVQDGEFEDEKCDDSPVCEYRLLTGEEYLLEDDEIFLFATGWTPVNRIGVTLNQTGWVNPVRREC
jgi:hypothetical protein